MCLTCRPCNLNTSRAEHAAVEAQRDEQKVQLRIPACRHRRLRLEGGGATFHLRMTKTRVPRTVLLSQALRSQKFDLTAASQPSAHYANVPWLKAAYLSVVSLLGPSATATPRAPPLNRVRQQIMQPRKEIIRHCVISFLTAGR